MKPQGIGVRIGLGVLCAALIVAAPAIGASDARLPVAKRAIAGLRSGIGAFTPAAADPKLAAAMARAGLTNSGFRYTPAMTIGRSRALTVAVRARTTRPRSAIAERLAPGGAVSTAGIAPVAYDLGVGVGWKRFALQGDVSRIETGAVTGSREAADIGVSYNAKKWSTRVQVAAQRPIGPSPRAVTGGESIALDVGGSFRLTRNLDVTAGVRYTSERDRLNRPQDDRRDSQAVYVGTAFRF